MKNIKSALAGFCLIGLLFVVIILGLGELVGLIWNAIGG